MGRHDLLGTLPQDQAKERRLREGAPPVAGEPIHGPSSR